MSPEITKKEWWEVEAEAKEQESDFFKWPVGSCKVRIMTAPVKVTSLSLGKYPNAKMLGVVPNDYKTKNAEENLSVQGWVVGIVRGKNSTADSNPAKKDLPEKDTAKILKLSNALLTELVQIKNNPDYAFSDYPVPFDITVSNTGDGAQRYKMLPSPSRTAVAENEIAMSKSINIPLIVERIISKKNGGTSDAPKVDYPENDINPEDIPF